MSLDTAGEKPSPLLQIPDALREPFLAALVHDFPLGVVLFDVAGHFLFVNEATAALNGVPAEEHTGRHIRDVVPDLWESARPILDRVRQGEVVQWEVTGETPAAPGAPITCAEQWFPVRDPAGEIVAVAGTIVDITQQRRLEESARHAAELHDRLIRLASHELRGPLTNVLGYAQRLEHRDDLQDAVRADLETIREQALEMRERLDLFLHLSEPGEEDAVRRPLDLAQVDLEQLVGDACRTVELRHPGVNFVPEHEGESSLVSEPRSLHPILVNLLDNAAKYAGRSDAVTVRTRSDGERATIEVEDRGPGIAVELQARLFEPGYRTDGAREDGVHGDGLGLFIAQRLASRIGGSLSVRSIPGDGATFILELPAQPRSE